MRLYLAFGPGSALADASSVATIASFILDMAVPFSPADDSHSGETRASMSASQCRATGNDPMARERAGDPRSSRRVRRQPSSSADEASRWLAIAKGEAMGRLVMRTIYCFGQRDRILNR